jgi:hypothetical protein
MRPVGPIVTGDSVFRNLRIYSARPDQKHRSGKCNFPEKGKAGDF